MWPNKEEWKQLQEIDCFILNHFNTSSPRDVEFFHETSFIRLVDFCSFEPKKCIVHDILNWIFILSHFLFTFINIFIAFCVIFGGFGFFVSQISHPVVQKSLEYLLDNLELEKILIRIYLNIQQQNNSTYNSTLIVNWFQFWNQFNRSGRN